MNTLGKAAIACCAALTLAACGTGDNAGSGGPKLLGTATGKAAAAAPAEPVAQDVNERGFIVKQLGAPACFGGAGKNCEGGVSFSVDQVDVDPPCSEFGSPPDNGHTVVLHLRIATGSDTEVADRVSGVINPFSFVEIGKDGVTRDTSFGMCADTSANDLPHTYGPNQQYEGIMELEVTEASGTIALQLTMADEDGERGWEWAYPVS